ncbi:Fructose import ATP-binding protein FrcA [Achromobacter mucicolens]|uniref:ABC transporter ATP-binding protein n=1 Tax=Achromobacter mucicolens TaxID=1389922 RepID=UPI0014678A4B|nr:ABC transporter ATP-binding protein [Achromobacter mucicolens]MDG9971810.1 ABC transporter ATP-binding protein [Achromobacter mucicolens]CAB3624119.1 Fructose import ATP-binding protein FrcA [Achromobacter mucicolens]
MTSQPKLEIRGLKKSFGAVHATQDVNLAVRPGELHALIGPNGAGKTTLLSQISGEILPDAGSIWLDGGDITRMPAHKRPAAGLARSFQISQLYPDFTAEDNVAMAVQAHSPGGFNLWRNARRMARLREPARDALERVGLGDRAGVRVSALAHGEKRQLELAMALSLDASVLLLDEPMAGMGAEESQRMTALLQTLKGRYAILLVEHDMDAVFALADRVTVLVYGKTIFTGTPDEVRRHPDVRAAYLGEEN